jgi:hypothetical protein
MKEVFIFIEQDNDLKLVCGQINSGIPSCEWVHCKR